MIEHFKRILVELGLTVSVGSYEDDDLICVFSVEGCGPCSFGHPKAMILFNKSMGFIQAEGLAARYENDLDIIYTIKAI